ncbi:MAG: PCRF domain-containing protein, partial [Firmicutes bacterium]|nr:PCRF domain-containing protein [Bacillota bacterium]
MSAPDFWDDQAAAQKIFKEISALRQPLETYHNLRRRFEDLEVMVELGAEEEDLSLGQEATGELVALDREVRQFQLEILLSGPYDRNNAILTLHAGAGGTEAMDWVEMLLRMYSRWAEGRGYRVETLDLLPGEEAGVKSVTILISGENAYGFLRPEKGVHRLVRISPFDASGRRHTS